MLAKRPNIGRLIAGVVVACCLVVAMAGTATAQKAPPDPQAYVKYYVVTAAYQGQPENLTEIATRFLGSGERSAEIYNLNAGRVQPDGASLTDPARLNRGWYLVLPWDAVGEGVQYGQVPSGARTPTKALTKTPRPTATAEPSGSPSPTPSASPSPTGTRNAPRCTAVAASSSRSDWAQLRLAADGAWDLSRGNGVMVAVVDSGVDGGLEQLSGRVAVGADVTVGNGRGDTDCLGTGTAMANIIAANPGTQKIPAGLAPDATILPVRMVGTSGNGRATDAANAIEVAVSAGASVVALGGHVDLAAPAVAASLATALNHDVVVVAGAPTTPVTLPSPAESTATGALLLVGGVGANNQLVEEYQPDLVEVVAPGADVTSVGPGGAGALSYTGTRFAVAFVAGQAALVRAAYPELTAAQVEQRIRDTADAVGGENPDQRYGSGMINPAVSLARTLDGEQQTGAGASAGGGGGGGGGIATLVLIGIALVGGGAFLALGFHRRRAYS
ncbi:S8 family serine peptidase [Micromonospora radicis]|uniref:Peptidase S8 and S53 subtilisin kexin sedolisin n=1 Tax=Micromonospora radicis TaxID=1894971 RepID=A0A418MZ27_9ACTN|nr:S8 family serine peptidase [Micromonospora radicis]RIV40214.1 peptidase S8 and S53 subtilisin kexin sedolisin [Micromonospora radicis]